MNLIYTPKHSIKRPQAIRVERYDLIDKRMQRKAKLKRRAEASWLIKVMSVYSVVLVGLFIFFLDKV